MSLRGNCRTESDRMAWSPAIRMTRLTTIARTGRLTKRPVNFIWNPFPLSSRARIPFHCHPERESLSTVIPNENPFHCHPERESLPLSSRAKRGISPSFARSALAVLRLRGRVVGRLNLVVHDDGGAVAELEDSGGHDFLARLDAGDDRDLIPPRAAQLHELLVDAAVRLPFRTFQVADDEDRVAVRRVADRGRRQRDDRSAGSQHDLRFDEHTGPQLVLTIRERGLNLDVARGLID